VFIPAINFRMSAPFIRAATNVANDRVQQQTAIDATFHKLRLCLGSPLGQLLTRKTQSALICARVTVV